MLHNVWEYGFGIPYGFGTFSGDPKMHKPIWVTDRRFTSNLLKSFSSIKKRNDKMGSNSVLPPIKTGMERHLVS